ncbi:hypothetical protein G9A89_016145 [Geosiphon pyriformis]|nr:hypothetical protein G9A89_016145 [Geosiphon pyriformis]
MVDNMTPKKTRIKMYVLGQPPRKLSFNDMNNINDILELQSSKFQSSNQLPSIKSCVLEKKSFESVKLFTLDVELSAMLGKTNSDKLIAIKKIFYRIDGFGGASTLLKFSGIIKALFTSEFSIKKAKKLAICKKIIVNNNLRKVNSHLNQEVIIKKIPVDLPKLVISIRIQLIGLWQKALVKFELSDVISLVASKWSVLVNKNSVCVALALNNKELWMARNHHQALLYIFLVGTTAHGLSDLMNSYGKKTCFIGHNLGLYVCNRCTVVCFDSKTSKLAAIGSVSVYKGVNLHWAGLFLACCAKCKQFGHISDVCSVDENFEICHKWVVFFQDQVCLTNIYKKKQAPVAYPVSFGGKTWAQIAGSSSFYVVLSVSSGAGSLLSVKPLVSNSNSLNDSSLTNCMASLECFLELLLDQISKILRKLSFVDLVLMSSLSHVFLPVVAASLNSALSLDMAVNSVVVFFSYFLLVSNNATSDLSLSSSKVLTTKIGGLKLKMLALEVLVSSVLARLDSLCSGLGLSAPLPSQ